MAAAIEGMEDLVQEFLAESAESVAALERDVVALEREPSSGELLAEIFRAVHTLKGNSGIMGYPKLQLVAHAGENLLARMRDGSLVLSPEISNGLLAMVDTVRGLLGAIEKNGNEGEAEYTRVVELLEVLSANARPTSQDRVAAGEFIRKLEEQLPYRLKPVRDDHHEGTDEGAPFGSPRLACEGMPLQDGLRSSFSEHEAATLPRNAEGASSGSIRVGVSLLDRMVNLVGELVLARNQVLHVASGSRDPGFAEVVQHLTLVTTRLQESVMKARMQPIGNLWNRLPRLVRNMALQYGKEITIETSGSEIELDRTILEAVKGPLTHILRNAIDHGIESSELREQAGKTAAGHVRLNASQKGGRVYLEISDDGAGLDLERVRKRALNQELITAEQAANLSERELANLVFTPGFSTVDTVTNLSGRGVGLDVARTNIERIGGVVDLHSVSGRGTTLKINLPLTLAILRALIVSCGGERLAIPQASLIELVRLEPGLNAIEQVYGTPVYRLRDRLLPLVFLDRLLQLPRQNSPGTHVVVVEAGAGQFAMLVDAVGDTEEVVVKPLSRHLRGLTCFAGAAILGDGDVALILDVMGVAQLAKLSSSTSSQTPDTRARAARHSEPPRQSWITFRGAAGSRFALPMSSVARLEEIPARTVELSDGHEVIQYSGKILPLVRLSDLFHEPSLESEVLQLLVLRESAMGLVVDRIEDIVEGTVELRSSGPGGLLQGAAVIQGRVADVLDLEHLLALGREPFTLLATARRSYGQ